MCDHKCVLERTRLLCFGAFYVLVFFIWIRNQEYLVRVRKHLVRGGMEYFYYVTCNHSHIL